MTSSRDRVSEQTKRLNVNFQKTTLWVGTEPQPPLHMQIFNIKQGFSPLSGQHVLNCILRTYLFVLTGVKEPGHSHVTAELGFLFQPSEYVSRSLSRPINCEPQLLSRHVSDLWTDDWAAATGHTYFKDTSQCRAGAKLKLLLQFISL